MGASSDPGFEVSADELAGVVDLFGALTREELARALAELAYKQGYEHEPAAFDDQVAAAVESYHLVVVEPGEGAPLLVAGPSAFPALPADARDLPHILDAPERTVDRETTARAAVERFRADAARALDAGEDGRVQTLIDVSYEVEAWGPVDLADVRDRLE